MHIADVIVGSFKTAPLFAGLEDTPTFREFAASNGAPMTAISHHRGRVVRSVCLGDMQLSLYRPQTTSKHDPRPTSIRGEAVFTELAPEKKG